MSRERRFTRLAQLHAKWVGRHAKDTPVSTEELDDGPMHHVDLGALPEAEAEFQRAATEIVPHDSNLLDYAELISDAALDAHWLRGSAALADLRSAFADAGLPEPQIPDGLVSALVKQWDWCWGSRPVDPLDMYMFDRYPDEMLRSLIEGKPLDDYVAVAHAGHGVNSYFLTYQLVLGRVAVFMQVLWGGAYMDETESRLRVRQAFAGVATLLQASRSLLGASAGSGPRLVVLSSERPVGAVGWVDPGSAEPSTAGAWREEHAWPPGDVFARALDLVLEAI